MIFIKSLSLLALQKTPRTIVQSIVQKAVAIEAKDVLAFGAFVAQHFLPLVLDTIVSFLGRNPNQPETSKTGRRFVRRRQSELGIEGARMDTHWIRRYHLYWGFGFRFDS